MAVEIVAVRGCNACAGVTCPRCLGCPTCATYAVGCVCPSDEPVERSAGLVARHRLAQHVDTCFPCSLEWATDCDEGRELRAAAVALWRQHEGVQP